jgi:hypothetical protein
MPDDIVAGQRHRRCVPFSLKCRLRNWTRTRLQIKQNPAEEPSAGLAG